MTHRFTRLGAMATGLLALALTVPAAPAAAADTTDITIKGGDGNSSVVCGNIAEALNQAKKPGWKLQLNNCKANANGGSVGLSGIEIYVSQSAAKQNSVALAALNGASARAGFAFDKCENKKPKGSSQMTKCIATGRGGKVFLNNVTVVKGASARTIEAGVVERAAPPKGADGGAAAKCWNVVAHPLKQRDDCSTYGGGAWWGLKDVSVKGYKGQGMINNVDIDIRGGDANNYTACYNVTDGSGKVKQINICTADGRGGDVTLSNIKIITVQ